eukprot:597248-Pyramimonas_sp.AAC.1
MLLGFYSSYTKERCVDARPNSGGPSYLNRDCAGDRTAPADNRNKRKKGTRTVKPQAQFRLCRDAPSLSDLMGARVGTRADSMYWRARPCSQ